MISHLILSNYQANMSCNCVWNNFPNANLLLLKLSSHIYDVLKDGGQLKANDTASWLSSSPSLSLFSVCLICLSVSLPPTPCASPSLFLPLFRASEIFCNSLCPLLWNVGGAYYYWLVRLFVRSFVKLFMYNFGTVHARLGMLGCCNFICGFLMEKIAGQYIFLVRVMPLSGVMPLLEMRRKSC